MRRWVRTLCPDEEGEGDGGVVCTTRATFVQIRREDFEFVNLIFQRKDSDTGVCLAGLFLLDDPETRLPYKDDLIGTPRLFRPNSICLAHNGQQCDRNCRRGSHSFMPCPPCHPTIQPPPPVHPPPPTPSHSLHPMRTSLRTQQSSLFPATVHHVTCMSLRLRI